MQDRASIRVDQETERLPERNSAGSWSAAHDQRAIPGIAPKRCAHA
jgi:hypothetical protein